MISPPMQERTTTPVLQDYKTHTERKLSGSAVVCHVRFRGVCTGIWSGCCQKDAWRQPVPLLPDRSEPVQSHQQMESETGAWSSDLLYQWHQSLSYRHCHRGDVYESKDDRGQYIRNSRCGREWRRCLPEILQ